MTGVTSYRCTECGDLIDAPGLCDYHYAFKVGVEKERERITKLIQGLLDGAINNSVQKPEYYDDASIYRELIELITKKIK